MSWTRQKLHRFQVQTKEGAWVCGATNRIGGPHGGHRTMAAARKCAQRALRNTHDRGLQIRDRLLQKDFCLKAAAR